MKNTVTISQYAVGRNSVSKLTKLKEELEKLFNEYKGRTGQEIAEEGLIIDINMSAKYQTLYVKVSNWGNYLAVGEFETLVEDALETRGFETLNSWDGDEEHIKIEFN